MRSGDDGGLDPRLEQRLRDELDQVQPSFSSPRYLSASRRPMILRLAPAVLVVTVVGMLGLTAYAGSPNPVVWTERVVNVVNSAVASPAPQQSPAEHHESSGPSQKPVQHESPEASGSPEPRESPEPSGSPETHESPEPTGGGSDGGSSGGGGTSSGGSGSGSGESSPQPSPSPESH